MATGPRRLTCEYKYKIRSIRLTLYKLCAVRTKMCSTNQAHHKYKRGCGVRVRHIIRDLKFERFHLKQKFERSHLKQTFLLSAEHHMTVIWSRLMRFWLKIFFCIKHLIIQTQYSWYRDLKGKQPWLIMTRAITLPSTKLRYYNCVRSDYFTLSLSSSNVKRPVT